MHQVIIIGAGPAGMTAAIYCVRKGLTTLVIGKDIGGQVAKSGEVENWLGMGSTTGADLAATFHKHVEAFENIEHKHGVLVTELKKKNGGFVVVTDEDTYEAEAVIIATGRKPRTLNVPGEQEFTNKGVSYCDVCDGPLFKGKDVAIVGGGNTAMEAAISMAALSPQVHVVSLTPQLTGDKILAKKITETNNITVISEASTKQIIGDTFVKGLVYTDNKGKEHTIPVSAVFIEIGYIPSNTFETLTEKDEHNRIKVNSTCETNVKGLFAAGDATDIRDNQIVISAGEGAKAALSAFYYLAHTNV